MVSTRARTWTMWHFLWAGLELGCFAWKELARFLMSRSEIIRKFFMNRPFLLRSRSRGNAKPHACWKDRCQRENFLARPERAMEPLGQPTACRASKRLRSKHGFRLAPLP